MINIDSFRRTVFNFIQDNVEMIGRKGAVWITVCIISSLCLAILEYLIAHSLQLYLHSIGLIEVNSSTSWNFVLEHDFGIYFLLGFIALARFIAQYFNLQSTIVFSQKVMERLKVEATRNFLFSKNFISSAEVNNQFGEIFVKATSFFVVLARLISFGCQIIFLSLFMIYLLPKEAAIAFMLSALLAVVSHQLSRRISFFSKQLPLHNKKALSGIERISRNKLFIKISKVEKDEFEKISSKINSYTSATIKSFKFINLSMAAPQFLGVLVLCAVTIICIRYLGTNESVFLIFTYILFRLLQTASSSSQAVGQALAFYPHYKIALDNFRSSSKSVTIERTADSRVVSISPPSIKISNLSYSWSVNNELKPLLRELNLTVVSGEFIGICGDSGSGKSTLIRLVLGLEEANTGEVNIDHMRCDEYIALNHHSIAYAGPTPFLIEGTLRENLLYGNHDNVSDDKMYSILEKLNLSSLVDSYDDKLDHWFDEDASCLSAGQKQRLSIARAVIRNPKLLILDEATANLDYNNELKVCNLLRSLDATIIAISHKDSFLLNTDRVLKLTREGISIIS